ncbi:MAG: lysophospholipid acyltransferase family protein [Pseudorhodobacter sp.]
MTEWRRDEVPYERIGPVGWLRAGVRAVLFAIVVFGGLLILLALRLFEAPLFGKTRPWSPYVTQVVCRLCLPVLGLRATIRGRPMACRGAVVANHASWLDIIVLNAFDRVYFVSKSEVAAWPVIGWLARATGTLFIARDPAAAKHQQAQFETRLRAGHRLLFFPEGTSTDSRRILPFKTTLFAAFYTHGMEEIMHVQPVTVNYTAPGGKDPRFYGWWGDMDFATHMFVVLACPKPGHVALIYHDPVPVDEFKGRKPLAAHLEDVIRKGIPD